MGRTIVHKYAKQTLAKEFLDRVPKECVGFALAHNGDLVVDKSIKPQTTADLMDEIYFEAPMILSFESKGTPLEKIQPHVLIADKDNKPIVSVFLDENVQDVDAVHKYLSAKIAQLYRLADGDAAKLLSELQSELTKSEMMAQCKDTTSLMFASGAIVTYPRDGKMLAQFPWGWTTNTHGYTHVKKPEEKPAAELTMREKLALKFNTTAKTAPPPKAETKVPEKVAEPAKNTSEVVHPAGGTKIDAEKLFEGEKVTCPKTISKDRKIKKYYIDHAGFCPSNYLDYPTVVSKKKLQPVDMAARQTANGVHTTESVGKPLNQATDADEKQREKFSAFCSTLDKNSQKVTDPSTIQDDESEELAFTQISPFDSLEETYTWTYDQRVKLAKEFPEYEARLAQELTLALMEARAAMAQGKKPAVEETAEERKARIKASMSVKKAANM